MPTCFIVQPIHRDGIAMLEAGGITVRQASSADMETVAREVVGADAVLTRNAGLNGAAIRAAGPGLRVISNHGVGVNMVDLDQAEALNIPVVNTPGANAQSVAEHAIMLALAVARRVGAHDPAVRAGQWNRRYEPGLQELRGKTLGLAGFGTIGQLTGKIGHLGFGMRVIVYSPSTPEALIREHGFEPCDLETLVRESDVLSLHRSSRPDTRRFIDAKTLSLMKPTAIVVNTSRGDLIDTQALVDALTQGQIAGAGLDVMDPEPLPDGHPLLGLENVVFTPHTGGSTEEALKATAVMCASQILDVFAGKRPQHLVRPAVWDKRLAQV